MFLLAHTCCYFDTLHMRMHARAHSRAHTCTHTHVRTFTLGNIHTYTTISTVYHTLLFLLKKEKHHMAFLPGPSLPGASLPGASLPGASLPGASLPGASLPCSNR